MSAIDRCGEVPAIDRYGHRAVRAAIPSATPGSAHTGRSQSRQRYRGIPKRPIAARPARIWRHRTAACPSAAPTRFASRPPPCDARSAARAAFDDVRCRGFWPSWEPAPWGSPIRMRRAFSPKLGEYQPNHCKAAYAICRSRAVKRSKVPQIFTVLFLRGVQRVAARTGFPTWAILFVIAVIGCGVITAISAAQRNF